MKTACFTAILVVAGAGAAAAAPYGEPDYVPGQSWVGGVEGEWMPAGSMLYSGNQGEIDFDVDTAWALSGWVGYEIDGGLEVGIATRFIGNEHVTDSTFTADELIVGPRFTFHTRPWGRLDVSFSIAPAYSHVFFPSDAGWPDPSGLTVDFAAAAAYPISGDRLYGVVSFGYQRGFQRTTELSIVPPHMSSETDFATDYGHLGAGVAYRF